MQRCGTAEDGGPGTQNLARQVCSSSVLSDTARGSSGKLRRWCTWQGEARDSPQTGGLDLPLERNQESMQGMEVLRHFAKIKFEVSSVHSCCLLLHMPCLLPSPLSLGFPFVCPLSISSHHCAHLPSVPAALMLFVSHALCL